MKKYITVFGLCLLWACCNKEDDYPSIELPELDFAMMAGNTVDYEMLCLAEAISKALLDQRFRDFIKSESVNGNQNGNNEILLALFLDRVIYENLTLSEILSEVLAVSPTACFGTAVELEGIIANNPALVLKIPDIIDAAEWDTKQTVPFVYARTNQLVEFGTPSIIGLHGSGLANQYFDGIPDYYPIVLKASEDFLLVDKDLHLSNGVNLQSYHDFDAAQLALDGLLGNPILLDEALWYAPPINGLVREINAQCGKTEEPINIGACPEDCIFDCIPDGSRKLVAKNVLIHSQNNAALSHEFDASYRFDSHFILYDNAIFLAFTKHMDNSGVGEWKKNLVGSFRLQDLYDVVSSTQIHHKTYKIGGVETELPEVDIQYEVTGTLSLPLDHLVLASQIDPGDLIRFASVRLKMDMVMTNMDAINGEVIQVADFSSDNVTNYDLYCFNNNNLLGFNSLSIECDF